MERERLTQLDRDALIEIVLQQQGVIERLTAEVARLTGPVKTPGNSSVPPSVGFKPNRAERRARRKRGGQLGLSRHRREPDLVVECRPTACRGCGAALGGSDQRRVGRSQVIDLPPVEPVVVEAWRYAAVCPGCGERTVAAPPPGLEPERVFGPGVEALLGYLHERHHLSYERLVEVCRDLFGLAISEGAVANALGRLAERARPTYEVIGAEVRAGPVINSDETSARVGGRNWWQWVFQTPGASYHVIAPSRGAEVIEAFLQGATPEVWGSDLWAPQVGAAARAHQVCMSHQVRDLTYAEEADAPAEARWGRDLRHVFGRALRLRHERERVSPATFARRRVLIEKATDRLVFGPPLPPESEGRRLQKRYRQHRDSLYVFLDRTDVEPTNNASERDLRNSVIHRKVTGGHRSAKGAESSAILTTVLTTARKRGRNLYDALRALAGPSPLQADLPAR